MQKLTKKYFWLLVKALDSSLTLVGLAHVSPTVVVYITACLVRTSTVHWVVG